MSSFAVGEIVNDVFLNYYLDEVVGFSCQILGVSFESVALIGKPERIPKVPPKVFEELTNSPVAVSVPGGRACGLFQRNELMGFAIVGIENESQVAAADFVFQILNEHISQRSSKEDLEFDIAYLRNIIGHMQRMFQKLAAVFDVEEAAKVFLKECEMLFATRSGAVVALDRGKLRVLASYGAPFNDQEIVEHICDSGKSLLCNDVASDARFLRKTKDGRTIPFAFRNILAAPIEITDRMSGALVLFDKEAGPFWVEDQRMVQAVAVVLGSTLSNIQLHENLVQNERVKSTLERYLSPNLVKEIIESGGFQSLGGKRMTATILFSDIRGFTKLAEKVSAEQLVAQLNEYFEEMAKIIFAYDGTLDKYVGDMIMVLFGVPKPMADSPIRALHTAVEMQKRLALLNAKWATEGKPQFGVGIGINHGDVIFGNIGSSSAMGLTVIGDHVNRAQRLEAFAGAGQIMISDSMYEATRTGPYKASGLGTIEVKGKKIDAFRLDFGS